MLGTCASPDQGHIAIAGRPGLLSEGLRQFLARRGWRVHVPADPIEWVGSLTEAAAAMTTESNLERYVMLALPGPDQSTVLDRSATRGVPIIPVAIVDDQSSDLRRARAEGATVALPVDVGLDELEVCLMAATRGFFVAPPGVSRYPTPEEMRPPNRSLRTQGQEPPEWQRNLLMDLGRGLTITDIADLRNYSRREIHRRVNELCRRFSVRNRTQLVVKATYLGLIKPD